MSNLLREIATLPHVDGSLAIKILACEMAGGFCLIRINMSPEVEVDVVGDGSGRGLGEAGATPGCCPELQPCSSCWPVCSPSGARPSRATRRSTVAMP